MRYFLPIALVMVLLVSSCSKKSFRISVSIPAEIAVPEGVNSFLVVNNVNDTNSPDALLRQTSIAKQPNGNIIASEQVITGLLRAFDESRFYRGVVVKDVDVRMPNKIVDWQKIDSLCAVNEVQGIIEIEYFTSQAPVGGVVLGNVLGSTNHPLRGTAFVNMYLSGYQSQLERLDMSEMVNIPISGTLNPLNVLTDVLRKREFYGLLGNSIGRRMGYSLSPTWIWVGREYYKKGSREIKLSKNLIRRGHWDLAERQLTPALNSPKRKVRGRAMFNMALVYEGQGHLLKAIDMAEKAAFDTGIRPAYEYINVLKRRTNQQSRIYFP
jgi:hypothetical protein